MPAAEKHQPVDYGVYTAEAAAEMARLLGEVFSRRDPSAVAVGVTPSEFEAFVRLFCPKAAEMPATHGHSVKCPGMWPHQHVNADASSAALRARQLRAGYVRRYAADDSARHGRGFQGGTQA